MKTEINASTLMNGLTLRVTVSGVKNLRIRIFLGSLLIRIAARVMGCNVELNMTDRKSTDIEERIVRSERGKDGLPRR